MLRLHRRQPPPPRSAPTEDGRTTHKKNHRTRRYDEGGRVVASTLDVPPEHWDRVFASAALSREQVLLFLANWSLQDERLAVLRRRRAELSALLSASPVPGDVGGAGGGGGVPIAGGTWAASPILAEELVQELADVSQCEREVLLVHAMVG